MSDGTLRAAPGCAYPSRWVPSSNDHLDDLLAAIDAMRATRGSIAVEDVRLTLQGAKARGWPFERAWLVAINRVQPMNSQGGRLAVDPLEASELHEARALLEEDRALIRAIYEERSMTPIEAARRMVVALDRIESAPGPSFASATQRVPLGR